MVVTAAEHFRLLVGVRWRSYRNALRKSSVKRAKFLTALLTWLLAGIGGIGSALAFAALGYAGGSKGQPAVIGLALFIIFALWQLAPVIFEVTAPMVDFRDIARYPIAFRTFYGLHLAYGLLDPAVILGIVWLVLLWAGLLFARPVWALHALLPFLLFALFNLVSNRFIITLLDRVLATRRGRERVMASFLLLLVAAQIMVYGIGPRFGPAGIKQLLLRIAPLWTWSPPGVATWSITTPLPRLALAISVIAVFISVAAWLLQWQLRSIFAGEIYSESRRRSGAVQVKTGWSLPLLDGTTSAIVEKELRYCLRDARTLMNIASPTIFALMIVLGRGAAQKIMATGLKVQSGGSNIQVVFSAAAVFILAYLAYNSFGLDDAGFHRWPLSPLSYRQVLIGKNIAVTLLWATSVMLVNLVLLAGGNYSLRRLVLTLIGVTYGALGVLAAGNQLSVRMPLKVKSGSITSKAMPEGTMLGSMLLLLILGGSAWLTVAAARWLARPWITPAGLLLLAAVAAALYVASLNNAARYLDRNLERIAAELT